VELHKPYFEDEDPRPPVGGSSKWQLVIDGEPVDIEWTGSRRFHVIRFEDPNAAVVFGGSLLLVTFNDPCEPADPSGVFGYAKRTPAVQDVNAVAVGPGSTVLLQRRTSVGYITVDSVRVPDANSVEGWLSADGVARSVQRDITLHKCIRRLWDAAAKPATLGQPNTYVHPDARLVQAHPYLDPAVYTDRSGRIGFKTIGEIGMVFAASGYDVPPGSTEADLRLDFRNPLFGKLLNYLTVIDPADYGASVGENRIKGRININTAPPYVLAQLPWMTPAGVGLAIVEKVVADRDRLLRGFRCISELLWVSSEPGSPGMDLYATDGIDQRGRPDLTCLKLPEESWTAVRDGATDDFEERDLIFQRISNLITVRSDVFTAYILVRIGTDGPQRRVIAILDRSDVEPPAGSSYTGGKVKVRVLHQVADPW